METAANARRDDDVTAAPFSSAEKPKRRRRRRRKSNKTCVCDYIATDFEFDSIAPQVNLANGNRPALLRVANNDNEFDESAVQCGPISFLDDAEVSVPPAAQPSSPMETKFSGVLVTTTADIHEERDNINSVKPTTICSTNSHNENEIEEDQHRWRRRRQDLRRFSDHAIDLTLFSTTTTAEPTAPSFEDQEDFYTSTLPHSNSLILPLCNFHRQQIAGDVEIDLKQELLKHHYQLSQCQSVDSEEDTANRTNQQWQLFDADNLTRQSMVADDGSVVNIAQKYYFLMNKSSLAWKRLRQLPWATPATAWHSTFLRCFEIYNWLWKMQHIYRYELCSQTGLTRWQVGELAQKIGQLYFNFYVRTSETDFLLQSFKFYNAIRERGYFEWRSSSPPANTAYMHQQSLKNLRVIRYLCRLIVTSVLLKKVRFAKQILNELAVVIDIYCCCSYNSSVEAGAPIDEQQQNNKWRKLLDNLLNFLTYDQLVKVFSDSIVASNGLPSVAAAPTPHRQCSVVLRHRLISASTIIQPSVNPLQTTYQQSNLMFPRLAASSDSSSFLIEQAVICGNTHQQIQFGDLQVDMFRFLQTIEWETSESAASLFLSSSASSSSALSTATTDSFSDQYRRTPHASASVDKGRSRTTTPSMMCDQISVRAAPRKYMLLKPTFSLLMTTVTHAFNELTSNGVLLLYFSCDSVRNNAFSSEERQNVMAKRDGLLLQSSGADLRKIKKTFTSMNEVLITEEQKRAEAAATTVYCIYPADMIPFMRKPLFVIVDSPAGDSFRQQFLLEQQTNNNDNFFALFPPRFLPAAISARLSGGDDGGVPNQYGRLLTLFLLSPCTALCLMCAVSENRSRLQRFPVPLQRWVDALSCSHDVIELLSNEFDPALATQVQKKIFDDTFGRLLLLRFVFFQYICKMHCDFSQNIDDNPATYFPTCVPALPRTMYECSSVRQRIYDCAQQLECSDQLFLNP